MKERTAVFEEETVQADARGRIGLGRKNALYIKRIEEDGSIRLIPSRAVPESQAEGLILLARSEMEGFISRLENPKPKNAAFEKARSRYKARQG